MYNGEFKDGKICGEGSYQVFKLLNRKSGQMEESMKVLGQMIN